MLMVTNGSENMDTTYLKTLEKKDSFSRAGLLAAMEKYGVQISDSMFTRKLYPVTAG